MDYIVIENVPPYEGRWPFDIEGQELTTREWGWIKRLSGYLPLTIEDAGGDPELICVFAAIALKRAGKVEAPGVPALYERLIDAPFDGSSITMETDVEEVPEEGVPPTSSMNENGAASGRSSTPSSETSPTIPTTSGTPGSATSVSVPQRSGN